MEDDNKQHSFFLRKLAVERKDFLHFTIALLLLLLYPFFLGKYIEMFICLQVTLYFHANQKNVLGKCVFDGNKSFPTILSS